VRHLAVFCHPSVDSFGAAALARVRAALGGADHELRVIDLYRDGFDPVLSTAEWHSYHADTARNVAGLQSHVDSLRWAESLILLFPTWMYGPPAMLKGWMERVWLPGVAFEVTKRRLPPTQGRLRNIRRLTVITTSGSPWWWLRLIRDPCRSSFTRGFRHLFHVRCKIRWLQLHDMNFASDAARRTFLDRVQREVA